MQNENILFEWLLRNSVGSFLYRKLYHGVILRYFQASEGPEAVGLSYGEFALLLNSSTTPLESMCLALNQFINYSRWLHKVYVYVPDCAAPG